MGLPQKGELTLASSINEMQTLLENQRDSIQASGKGYSSDIEYEQFDSCIFKDVEYISIYEGTHQGRTPDVNPTYWENRLEFDGINDLTNLYVAKDSKQSLSATNALGINNYTLSLNKGDGSTETISLPQTNLSTYVQQNSNRALHSTDALRIGDNVIYLYKGDGSFESVNISEGIPDYISKSSIQALHATEALRISGNTISLYKGNGASESVTVPNNSFGESQTWQDVKNSRSVGVTYTNNTGRTIVVVVRTTASGAELVIDGVGMGVVAVYGTTGIVPNGSSYRLNGTDMVTWAELR